MQKVVRRRDDSTENVHNEGDGVLPVDHWSERMAGLHTDKVE